MNIILFPFLIGKVLTWAKNTYFAGNKEAMFPFLIGKVLTNYTWGEIFDSFKVSIPYR